MLWLIDGVRDDDSPAQDAGLTRRAGTTMSGGPSASMHGEGGVSPPLVLDAAAAGVSASDLCEVDKFAMTVVEFDRLRFQFAATIETSGRTVTFLVSVSIL